jgi:hypothetical protein
MTDSYAPFVRHRIAMHLSVNSIIRSIQAPDDKLHIAIEGMTKNELENHASDLLMIAVNHRADSVIEALLKKGLRSGHALDAAVHLRDLRIVTQLLEAGVTPSHGAEGIATRLHEPTIAQAISRKRDENDAFRLDVEF